MRTKISSLKKANKKFNNEKPGNTEDICEIKGVDILIMRTLELYNLKKANKYSFK